MKKLIVYLLVLCFVCACPPKIGQCSIFGPQDEWNRPIENDPVDYMSDCYIQEQFAGKYIRLGIPFVTTDGSQLAEITYGVDGENYESESDKGPFPIPLDAPIEGGSSSNPNPTSGDRHVISIDTSKCMLYELYASVRQPNGFRCASSAKFNLSATNYKRPAGWTSADAAGLPIFPGLLRYEEAATGNITHAIRFTVPKAQKAYTYPGNHYGPHSNVNYPIYGMRFRLKKTFDESQYSGPALAIVRALKKYGMIFADQGSAIYLSGVSNPGWGNTISIINNQKRIPGSEFEAVQPPFPIVRGFNPGSFSCNGKTQNDDPNWKPPAFNQECEAPSSPEPISSPKTSTAPGSSSSANAVSSAFIVGLLSLMILM